MSNALHEVTDPQRLAELRQFVQSLPISLINDPNVQWQLYRVWETSENYEDRGVYYYHVEIALNQQIPLKCIILWPLGQLYLDAQSLLLLVQWKIDASLDAFNAGHHWRYKGL